MNVISDDHIMTESTVVFTIHLQGSLHNGPLFNPNIERSGWARYPHTFQG